MKKGITISVLCLLGGCAPVTTQQNPVKTQQNSAQPMTAQEHLQAASEDEAKAKTQDEFAQSMWQERRGASDYFTHESQTLTYERHAEAHRQAAKKLEQTALSACAAIPSDRRSYCPLDDKKVFKNVAQIPRGIEVTVDSTQLGGMAQVEAQVKCHVAFGQAYGGVEVGCPLFLKSVQARVGGTDQNTVIALESKNPRDVLLLQTWGNSLRSK